MKKLIKVLIIVFGSSPFLGVAQNTFTLDLKRVDIDTLSYLKINKLIFYQDPLKIEYSSLVDKDYVPNWYDAYCANYNYEHFCDYPKEAVGLFHSISGVTEEMLAEHMKEMEAKGGINVAQEVLPYKYIFGEIWLTYLKTGENIIITQDYHTPKKINNLEFRQPILEANIWNEKTDSIAEKTGSIVAYIFENDTLKRANQPIVIDDMISNNSKYLIGGSIRSFKDVLYRAPTYIRSVIRDNKRVFETIENTPNGPKVIGVSYEL